MEKERLNQLVTKAKAGDPDAMNDLINASYQDIYFYALKIVKKEDLAADATQDSCIEIIQTIKKLKESAAFVTWCRRIVYHQCIKRIGNSRVVPLEENEEGETILDRIPDEAPRSLPDEIMEDREFRKVMMDMIDELPEGQRSALLLYYYERLSVKQIAQIQSENENTVKSRLHQGRKAVKKQVEAYEAKTGTKLYSIGVLPLLYVLFHAGKAEANKAAAAMAPRIQAAVAPSIAAASGATATAAAAGATIASSMAVKITAGVLAVALGAGAVAGGIYLSNQNDEDSPPSAGVPGGDPSHTHVYETWAFDEEAHWQICECKELSEREEHTYADGECTVCRKPEPLPSGNPLLTFDCTTLTGHWINITSDYKENLIDDFNVNEDGSISLQGKTYYPIGSTVDPESIFVYFRDTPYDPSVGVTEQEVHSSLVSIWLTKTGDYFAMEIFITDPETHNLAFNGNFYRESDYSGYEKVALTPENFSEYFTVTIEPYEFYYINTSFSAWQRVKFTLREDLGYPSWCQGQVNAQSRHCIVKCNVETHTYEITQPSTILSNKLLDVAFFGYSKTMTLMETDGSTIPIDKIVEWYGNVSENIVIESMEGYVFVPKQ